MVIISSAIVLFIISAYLIWGFTPDEEKVYGMCLKIKYTNKSENVLAIFVVLIFIFVSGLIALNYYFISKQLYNTSKLWLIVPFITEIFVVFLLVVTLKYQRAKSDILATAETIAKALMCRDYSGFKNAIIQSVNNSYRNCNNHIPEEQYIKQLRFMFDKIVFSAIWHLCQEPYNSINQEALLSAIEIYKKISTKPLFTDEDYENVTKLAEQSAIEHSEKLSDIQYYSTKSAAEYYSEVFKERVEQAVSENNR